LTAFSFYATKTLTTGEGGMITTDADDIADRMRIMRLHGIGRDAWKRYSAEGSWHYEVLDAGFKYNLTDIAAAIGLVQLGKCDAMSAARARIAAMYSNAFRKHEALEAPKVKDDRATSWHLYVLRIDPERLTISRDQFIERLRQAGISTSVHFIPLHMHPYYQKTYGYRTGDLPTAEAEYKRYLSLPIFPTMSDEQIEQVISAVVKTVETSTR
jgi:perosamine synthetase